MSKRYPAYKPSGIEWIGEIPEHWTVRKLSRSYEKIGSGTTPSVDNRTYYEEGTIDWVNTGDLNDAYLTKCSKKVTEAALNEHSSLKVFPIGSVIMAMYGATIGKLSILRIPACTNQACCVLTQSRYFENRYTFYWLMANRQHIISMAYGGGQPNISQELVRSLRVTAPPIYEQKTIAAYLDQKTALIDQTIQKKQRLIDLLQEERTALINRAVTRGLNPDVQLKPSGVEWLGDVPEHWKVVKLKYIARLKSGDSITAESISEFGAYPVYGGNGFRGYTNSYTHDGSFPLIGRQGALCGNVNYAEGKFWASEHAVVVTPTGDNNFFWLGELLRRMNLNQYSQSAAQPGLAVDFIQNLSIPVPPKNEQDQIAAYIKDLSTRTGKTLERIEREITLLQEYRTALINEVVTGKRCVIDNKASDEIPMLLSETSTRTSIAQPA